MRTTAGFALREVRKTFEHVMEQMGRMHGDCQVKPADVGVIKSVEGQGNEIALKCEPVVCRVPARASHPNASLYIVFTGLITFLAERADDRLPTLRYGTNFAYFEVQGGSARHVLGGHYDFSPTDVAHPRAHLQLRSQAALYAHAQEQFRSIAGVPLTVDLMQPILTGTRAPSAQMDFLSFMLQVCADHLVDEKSSAQVVSMFQALASSCSPVLGYHANMPDECGCHRAAHWYPMS